jgi:TonB family protein
MIQKTKPISRWKQWLVLPLLGVLLVAVACEKAAPAAPTQSIELQKIDGQNQLVVHNGSSATTLPPPPVVYEAVEQMPELPGGGGPEAIVRNIQQHLQYPKVAPANRKDGRMFISFIVTEKGEVQAVKVLKSLGPEYDAAVQAAIRQLPAFVPGRKDGKAVAVSYTVPIQFAWQASTVIFGGVPLNWLGIAVQSYGSGC